jgi:very-short-patch-repair endonuclease
LIHYHNIEKDRKRDQYLEDFGFSILRFENRLVFKEPEFIKNEIIKAFKKQILDLNKQSTTPAGIGF